MGRLLTTRQRLWLATTIATAAGLICLGRLLWRTT